MSSALFCTFCTFQVICDWAPFFTDLILESYWSLPSLTLPLQSGSKLYHSTNIVQSLSSSVCSLSVSWPRSPSSPSLVCGANSSELLPTQDSLPPKTPTGIISLIHPEDHSYFCLASHHFWLTLKTSTSQCYIISLYFLKYLIL